MKKLKAFKNNVKKNKPKKNIKKKKRKKDPSFWEKDGTMQGAFLKPPQRGVHFDIKEAGEENEHQ